MKSNTRIFSEKLHQALDEMDAPTQVNERIQILSKLFNIPKHLANSLLQGQYLPDQELLQKICDELEFRFELV